MSIETLTAQILDKMSGIHKWQRDFMIHLFSLLLSVRGRHNFENLSRYGAYSEPTYRSWYDRSFDFCTFNVELVGSLPPEERFLAFDPCFLPKSGKHTAGAGYFWSGSAGTTSYGLEMAGFASIGLKSRTALHLEAKQTIDHKECESLLHYYAGLFKASADKFRSLSSILAVDSYFARRPFVDQIVAEGFTLISKLASNAVLFYPNLESKTGKRGRPKKYAGRVDRLSLDSQHFKCFQQTDTFCAFEGIVYVKALKRLVKCVIVQRKRKNASLKAEVYFSTNTQMPGSKILEIYKLRFQIEFLYRDGKQHLGLSQCQARSKEKIYTHMNASLTTVSLAKAVHHLPNEKDKPFSLASIKNQYFNEHLMDKFFIAFGMNTENLKNSKHYTDLYNYGCIAT